MKQLLFLATLITSATSFSQTTFDAFTYTEPKHFVKDASGKGTVTYAHQSDSTFCVIGLYQSIPSKGAVQKDFDAAWKTILDKMKLHAVARKEAVHITDGWKMQTGYAQVQFEGVPSVIYLTTISGNGIAANFIYLTNSDIYSKVLEDFQNSLDVNKPVKATTTLVQPKPEPKADSSFALLNGGDITGVWINYGNNTPYISNSSVGFNWRIFFNNGKSLSNLPNGGFANVASNEYFDKAKNDANSFNLGTYNFASNKGANTKFGSKYSDKLELKKPNQLEIDGTVYMKCVSVNAQKLNGSFTTWANPNEPDLLNQPKGNRSVITFTTDGKFVDEGIYRVSLKDYNKGDDYNAPGSGIYELKDYSIILKFNDGRVKQEAFTIPFGNNTSSTKIILISKASLQKMK